MTDKQPLTDRMKLRIQALSALKNALLPGFCEGMVCDQTCPLYIHKYLHKRNEPCEWMKTYEAIDRMELIKHEGD
jgi:hypothetical protein